MRNCDLEGSAMREDLNLFGFYCRMMDHRLEGLHNTIEKKERLG